MSSWKAYGAEEPWFCDDAAALTGLKYGWAIASLAVNRSWRCKFSFVEVNRALQAIEDDVPGDHTVIACPESLWHRC